MPLPWPSRALLPHLWDCRRVEQCLQSLKIPLGQQSCCFSQQTPSRKGQQNKVASACGNLWRGRTQWLQPSPQNALRWVRTRPPLALEIGNKALSGQHLLRYSPVSKSEAATISRCTMLFGTHSPPPPDSRGPVAQVLREPPAAPLPGTSQAASQSKAVQEGPPSPPAGAESWAGVFPVTSSLGDLGPFVGPSLA